MRLSLSQKWSAEELLANAEQIEGEVRNLVVAGIGVAVRKIFLKPAKWIVKSTAGKAARSATLAKLLREHPELDLQLISNLISKPEKANSHES